MSRYRFSLSLFSLPSLASSPFVLFSLLYRPLSTRGMRRESGADALAGNTICPVLRTLSLSLSVISIDHLSRSTGWIDWRLFRRSYYWAGVPFTRVAIGMINSRDGVRTGSDEAFGIREGGILFKYFNKISIFLMYFLLLLEMRNQQKCDNCSILKRLEIAFESIVNYPTTFGINNSRDKNEI